MLRMPRHRVLITARAFFAVTEQAAEPLTGQGIEIVPAARFGPLAEDELIAALQGCHGVVAASDPYTARVFAACPDLRVIARAGVGYDAVDLAAASAHGVVVTITPGRIAETVADFAFALLLNLSRRVPEAAAAMARDGWVGELLGGDVFGKCLGLVGMGAVGSAMARRAQGFSLRVLGHDPILPADQVIARGAEPASLDRLLAEADFVSLHASLSAANRHLLGAAELRRMKPDAYLINTARGGLIDTAALVEALDAGHLGGVALDAFEREPLPADHPLRRAPRCLLTPHLAFSTRENALDMARRAAGAVADVLGGRRPASATVLNPEAFVVAPG